MKENSQKNSTLRRRLSRIFLWLPVFFFALCLLAFSIFQIPKVQTRLINEVSFLISENTGFDVSIGHANLTWFDYMIIKDIRLFDHQNDSTMISVKELRVDFKLYDFIAKRKLNADLLTLNQPHLHIIKSNDSTAVNISRFLTDLKNIFRKNRKPREKKTSIHVDNIRINDGYFSFNDLRYEDIPTGKDYRHFVYDSMQAEISYFSFVNDSIGMDIISLKSRDTKNQLNVRQLNSHFSFTKKQMVFDDLTFRTDQSVITDSVVFKYDHPSNFSHFIDSVSFNAKFKESVLSTNELSLFNPSLDGIDKYVTLSGLLSGKVKRLRGKNIELKTGKNTSFAGNLELVGLPVLPETFIDLTVKKSSIDPLDISDLISEKLLEPVQNIGRVDFKGNFQGFLSDFVANADVFSSVGKIHTDINFKIDKRNKAWYEGALDLTNFDLRNILPNQDKLKHITMNGKIKGSGLKLENADFNLNARVDSVTIADYTYKKVKTNGKFTLGFFAGQLAAADRNLKFHSTIEIDLREDRNKINAKADLSEANLQALRLTKQNIRVQSNIDLDLKGLKTDDLIGYISLYNNRFKLDEDELKVDSIKLLSSRINEDRVIHLDTDGLNIEMNGRFKNSVFLRTLKDFYDEVKLNIMNNEEDLLAYYEDKKGAPLEKYQVSIDMNFRDINKFVQPFYPSFQISKDVNLHGSFQQDSISKLNVYGEIDSLSYDQNSWFSNFLDVNISKAFYGRNILSSASVTSENQLWSDKYESENIIGEVIWIDDSLSISANIEQAAYDNKISINTAIRFLTDSTQFHFHRSNMKILGKNWAWDKNNRITYHDGIWLFNNINASNGTERLEIYGAYADQIDQVLNIDLREINLENIQSFTNRNVSGSVDGRIRIKKQAEDDLIEGNVVARSVKIGNFSLGNIFGITNWNNEHKSLGVNLDLIHEGKKKIEIAGSYYPNRDFDKLDMVAKFDSADLKIAEPFLKNNFTNLDGYASGRFTIKGNFDYPILKGTGEVTKGEVLVNYLNTRYFFEGDLLFEENEISTKHMVLKDSDQNLAILEGGVFHDGFRNAVLDFHGEFENFKLLNTTAADNDAYYGVAYGTGSINFLGALTNIKISAEAQTAKGTRISIPLSESSDSRIERKEYIEFVDLSDKDKFQTVIEDFHNEEKLKIRGIELDFDIEFTPEAYVEIIFDVQAGDIIRGRGNGNIKLQINTDGDFAMFGDYTIETGGYNFTMYNIINKEFDIKNGSNISWYGDPYGAILNISASYRQLASLSPLMVKFVDPDDLNSPEARKKYPTIVDLKLDGNLLAPEIKFNIDITDYPQNSKLPNSSVTLDEAVTAFKARLRNNEQEMNRQVFSLIVLRNFSQENTFQVNSQTLSNSLSEFVSNQLSYWATQVDENLEVDVDLAGLSDDAFNTFQLRLSYTFLDGRLRVTRGSSLGGQDTRGDVSNVIGDWTVEYLLTEDGRFRAKMYSRSDLDAISQQTGESNIETGFSLQYIKSFDQLSQILSDNRKKNISKRRVESDSLKNKEI